MSARNVSWKASKSHRSDTIAVATSALERNRLTVRRYIGNGLPILTDYKPCLILGKDLVVHPEKHAPPYIPCGPNDFLSYQCGYPNPATRKIAEIVNRSAGEINRRALCAICETPMNRRVANAETVPLAASTEVSSAQALEHMNASGQSLAGWSRVDMPDPTNDNAETAASGDEGVRDDR